MATFYPQWKTVWLYSEVVRRNDKSAAERLLNDFVEVANAQLYPGEDSSRLSGYVRRAMADPLHWVRNEHAALLAAYHSFYTSPEWLALRYEVLAEQGARCQCCGASAKTGAVMHVDHIKPRSTHLELALTKDNLQVLCDACNLGKSNRDETDWRGPHGAIH